MGDRSAIEWTSATWNPIRGCSRVSEGCRNCYAERAAIRQATLKDRDYDPVRDRMEKVPAYYGLVKSTPAGPRWTGEVRFVPELLDLPLRWKRPRRIFVNSMSDLFHEKVEDAWIDRIFAVMAQASKHVFQVLTKRPERMRSYCVGVAALAPKDRSRRIIASMYQGHPFERHVANADDAHTGDFPWPLPNVHLGVSVENQATADERIPLLLRTPAAVRWVSYEPALGSVNFAGYLRRSAQSGHCINIDGQWWHEPGQCRGAIDNCSGRCCSPALDWLVIGGESGPGARPFDLAWARSAIAQCRAAGVPVFFKQTGSRPMVMRVGGVGIDPEQWPEHVRFKRHEADGCAHLFDALLRDRKGGDPAEWPEDLRVREFPR